MENPGELFSVVLCKGRLCTYDEVVDMFAKLNVVSYSVQYPEGTGDQLYKLAGSHMVHRLMTSPQKRGVYHMVIKNPIRIKKIPGKIQKKCSMVYNHDCKKNHDEYSLELPGNCDLPSGLYECSLTLTVSDPHWDIYQFISIDVPFEEYPDKNLECPPCYGELTLKVLRKVGPFPTFESPPLSEIIQLNLPTSLKNLQDSLKNLLSDFKKTFEI